MWLTLSVLSTTSKQCFDQPSGSYFEKLRRAKINKKKEKYLDNEVKILLQ